MAKFIILALGLLTIISFSVQSKALYPVQTKQIAPPPLQYDGILHPVVSLPIKRPENAFIQKEYYALGSSVKKGDLIVEWGSPELLNQLYQANREYIDSKETLHRLKSWDSSSAMMQATRDLTQAQHIMDEAKYRLEQTKRLYEAGIVSKEEFSIDKRNYEQALKSVEQMQSAWEQTKRKGDKLELNLAKMKYNVSKERYVSLKKQVDGLKFISPIDGIVIPSTESDEAEYGILISPLQWKVIVKVNERDAILLKPNQEAEITISALDNRKLLGKIEKINIQPIDKLDKTTIPKYEVTLMISSSMNDFAKLLRVGMTAFVSCQFSTIEGIFVPKQAISIDHDGAFVNLAVGENAVTKHRVEIGNKFTNDVQIVNGLKEGDNLVLFG